MVEIEVFEPGGDAKAFVFGPGLYPTQDSLTSSDPIMTLARVVVPAVINREEYTTLAQESIVRSVHDEINDESGAAKYRVTFQSKHSEIISFERLIESANGREALLRFESGIKTRADDISSDNLDTASEIGSSDSHQSLSGPGSRSNDSSSLECSGGGVVEASFKTTRSRRNLRRRDEQATDTSSSEQDSHGKRRNPKRNAPSIGGFYDFTNSRQNDRTFDGSHASEYVNLLESDVLPSTRKRKRGRPGRSHSTFDHELDGLKYQRLRKPPTRQSGRSTRNRQNMMEIEIDDIRAVKREPSRLNPRATGAREAFKTLASGHPFQIRHSQQCDTCGRWGGGQLVHCQGCVLSYHRHCLGPRHSRDHLVTKIGDAEFVLQCRRCINLTRRKDPTSPDQSICQICREPGPACAPFRERKTALQEERDREENDGEDPTYQVSTTLINNPKNVLFRCLYCWRAFHFYHLRPRSDVMVVDDDEEEHIATQRFKEYVRDWKCVDCTEQSVKVSGLVAWKPADPEAYIPGIQAYDMSEDDLEYLVRFENKSYFQCVWMLGAWVWGVTTTPMRRAFAKRNNWKNPPIMNTEDAIPEDYLRIDVVLDVRYTSIVGTRTEEVDKARIREVDEAFIKFKGLGYEDVVWEKVPGPEDGDRWTDFVMAYDNWVMGRYVHCPKAQALKLRLEKARSSDFTVLEKKKQPDKLIGGQLMQFQLDGVNWLYYRWYQMKNAILADEMGLGKTIQIIGLLATLVQDHNCFPFLLVVPNSTCPNWKREIKRWAPSLRVVTYFGSAIARSLAYQHELFPEGSKDLRCHIVVTSYDAAIDEGSRKFFRSVPWQGLIVDEGQRLKSDETILYNALTALNIGFKVLLTGTPLQNNARELFNLLQFLDGTFDASALEVEFAELTKQTIPQLHDLIRPFFLRRTKAQVLSFLPPLAQVILPVSMSTVQTKLYQSILSRNPDLVRAIFDKNRAKDRANLNNILMQLRKCLCHPFVYSRDIEDRSVEATASHRNLVEASAKLQLLELLLPKLQQRGHRVLIFSQFLEMLDIVEDFLDGLALTYQRLDGTISALKKQKRMDEFNAPNSPLFAFLLSTRAGGVGINLATADTVIILDPDFNPHQDIQALSRAHRIGQKNKVLVFQLMTRASAEERIVQVGRKKLALDHVLIEQMDRTDEDTVDVESILRYGAADILEGKQEEIRYDSASIDKLLDRTQIENTKTGEDDSAESQFSFARVWANDAGTMKDTLESDKDLEKAPDPGVWEKILSERARIAAQEAAARQQALGRGKRARQTVDYKTQTESKEADKAKNVLLDGSDTDFQDDKQSDDDEDDDEHDEGGNKELKDFIANQSTSIQRPRGLAATVPSTERASVSEQIRNAFQKANSTLGTPNQSAASRRSVEPQANLFRRAQVIWPANATQPPPLDHFDPENLMHQCFICGTWHHRGYCPLKVAGPELCNLCGLAHFGVARSCPHIRSETQVREMLDVLKQSPESKELVEIASKYLKGVKGHLVFAKKKKAEHATAVASGAAGFHEVQSAFAGTSGQVQALDGGGQSKGDSSTNEGITNGHGQQTPQLPGSN